MRLAPGVFVCLLAAAAPFFATNSRAQGKTPIKLYMAASLFNSRETSFNIQITERLEETGHFKAFLPQRDGFEGEDYGYLSDRLSQDVAKQALDDAITTIIYLLDLGKAIPESDVVVANLDEPIDEGLVVEITSAKNLGKPVVCFRTEWRSPFGSSDDRTRGIHDFVAFQCDEFINHVPSGNSQEDSETNLAALTKSIAHSARSARENSAPISKHALSGAGVTGRVIRDARFLFRDIGCISSCAKDGQSLTNIDTVVSRYVKNIDRFKSYPPKVTKTR